MLAVEEGDWLVTSLDDDFLCTDVIGEMLDGPHSAKESFFAEFEYLHSGGSCVLLA